jgi:hypothetical protein
MKRSIIRYKVKPDRVRENEQLVGAVYEELNRKRPDGIRYATFRLDDGVSFVHVVSIETADGENPLSQIEAFARFTENVRDRCDEPPVVNGLEEIGSYRLFGAEGDLA